MAQGNFPIGKGCAVLAAIIVGVPLVIVAVVGVRTWVPLQAADTAMVELDRHLGPDAAYHPAPSGAIPAERLEVFLEVRARLVTLCEDYGPIGECFESIESLETKDSKDLGEIGGVTSELGSAALAITPFLAKFFELRNISLLEASMGLEEYAYIYAVAYHDHLLSGRCRREIFSDGDPLSPEASTLLQGCLSRQTEAVRQAGVDDTRRHALETELTMMADDPARLLWQDGLPETVLASVALRRAELDLVFCSATAGLEMDRSSGRALRLALE